MKHNTNLLKMVVYAVMLIVVFTGLLEAASVSANINVADNGHYFEYDGQPVFLLGLGSWTPIKSDFDYFAHNQWYQSYGINYNRIAIRHKTGMPHQADEIQAWNRSTISGANDGGNKFDLNEWNPVFWDRLKGYLQDCEDRGIIVCIQFFDECSVEGTRSERWEYHPFNPQNNINNIPDLDTTDASYSSSTGWSKSFYNVNNSVLMTLQDSYVQKLLDETSQYGNIIYEMANEYGGEGSTQFPGHFAWPQHWIDFFSNYENANGVQLLLTNMPFGVKYDQPEYFAASGIDCIDGMLYKFSDIQGINDFLGAHYNQGKPIFAGKIGDDVGEQHGDINENIKGIWTLFVSGSAGSGIKGSHAADWTTDTTMEDMLSNIHNFIESGVEFWNMTPNDNLVTSGTAYCLANVGVEYVIYLPDGGSVTVDLSAATGTLGVEWYDPKNGTYNDDGTVTGGGNESFTPPFSGDAVLHLVSTVFDTGKGTYPSIPGTHTGTIKPSDDITVQKMYTYPYPGTVGHSEYMRIWNVSGTIAEGNWTGYERDWHTISFDKHFILKENKTYNYTIRTGSYPQIIHEPAANVTGGTITCGEFVDASGKSYNNKIPAIKLYSTGVASTSSSITDDLDYVPAGSGGDVPAVDIHNTVLYNSCNRAVKKIFRVLESIKGARLF